MVDKKRTISFLYIAVHVFVFLIGCLLIQTSFAQEDGDVWPTPNGLLAPSMLLTRSSPFDPPDTDSFVADDGPGLDTGCTFNTSPEHPLMIDVMIDVSVGPVDGDGYLIDPAPLIAQGIIPATVDIIMPGYDVDYNGSPPPERDEVIFNGTSLGLLTGDNNVWKLSTFTVSIDNIKFPAPPAPGSPPTPRANRIQINVDTLSTGRWCTAVDWVALILPVEPKVALTLEPTISNPVRVNNLASNDLIDVIYQQTSDASCNLTEVIGPKDDYPFSGPAESGWFGSGEVKIRTRLDACPTGSLPSDAEVEASWTIVGTSLHGTEVWSGPEGDMTLTMPNVIGSYDVEFEYKVDGDALPTVTRKLYVTKTTPITVGAPRISWYEHATDWASGLIDEADVLEHLLSGGYAYGGLNWRYGYSFGAVAKCHWTQLSADPITCDYSDCYVFSDVFENMAATLGIGGLSAVRTDGRGNGFVTTGAPSLDPAFTGSARPFAGGPYDKYEFSSHSLRSRGFFFPDYYDATFNGIYSAVDEFILWNHNGAVDYDADGGYLETFEGAKVYPVPGAHSYDSWGDYKYKAPAPLALLASANNDQGVMMIEPDLSIPGDVDYVTPDSNSDGAYEALIANVRVDVNRAGVYLVMATLNKDGEVVANMPEFESMKFTQDTLGNAPGTYTAELKFSGEQILRAGKNGPYDVKVIAFAEGSTPVQAMLPTPAYAYTQFGEKGSYLTDMTDTAVDTDGDARYDYLEAIVQAKVATAGEYVLQGTLMKAGKTVANTIERFSLDNGSHSLSLRFLGSTIFRSGEDGPYELVVGLFNADGERQADIGAMTQAYHHGEFEGLLDVTGAFSDQGVDTNGNGLFEQLKIQFNADLRAAGTFLASAALRNASGPLAVYLDEVKTFSHGEQTVTLNFSGPEINQLELDGPYFVRVTLRHPDTLEIIDQVAISDATAPYSHSDFEPISTPGAIVLTGASSDAGVDNNGNGLFDLLRVKVGVSLAKSDVYTWSARLVDVKGNEIGFNAKTGALNKGDSEIEFNFAGLPIGQNGIAGPYYVRGLLMYGSSGGNLVASSVATTKSYAASEFEGFVGPVKGDIDGDGDVDRDDLDAVVSARNTPATGSDDPRDLDGDGMITSLDARQLRLLCTRPYCATH
ncbi:hypothetical protein EUZ85_26735 [Hahella sp. KA22]|uniref:hypothetical protein n=1 Tax=Hahella sp. KA22 TaxID=1628392 RepID=UPI000FDE7EB3|nr:hypothetical protein [Hahella sp. KA22]AZZ94120.1 hypothetical protein ENC22_24150 [Hahella sp. KA22]QAY57494.1 hypothetical protein EUZ85_26735 [Hahella sp. KA22]